MGIELSQVREIFWKAIELDEDSRTTYLCAACPSEEVRVRVLHMLEGHARGDDWLGELMPFAGVGAAEGVVAASEPQTLGKYVVVRKIASGGMGVVYEGRQRSPSRSVAIKVLHHHVASRDGRRRLRREIEILARLRHPSIAQILDADAIEGEGTPFFVMELVSEAKSLIDTLTSGTRTVTPITRHSLR